MGLLGLFERREAPAAEERDSFWPISSSTGPWAEALHQFGSAYVAPEKAIRNAAVWSCMDLLCSTVSTTPIDTFRSVDTAPQKVTRPPLIASPSALVTSDVWLYQLVEGMVRGNAFGLIVGAGGVGGQYPTQVELIDPGSATDLKVVDGVGQLKIDGKVHHLWPHGDVFHVPGKNVRSGSPFGMSIIEYASGSIKAALAAEDYGSKYFTDGAHPTHLITADIKNLDPDQAQIIKEAYRRATTGTREPAVVGSGIKVDAMQSDPGSTQFLELMRFEIEQVARFFRVPPSMIFGAVSGQNVTYANASQADLNFLKHSLNVYLVRIEKALSRCLAGSLSAVFDRDKILQADPETKYKVDAVRLTNHLASVNEIRVEHGLQPWDDPIYDLPGLPAGASVPALIPQGGN